MLLIRHNSPVLKEDRRVFAAWIKVRAVFRAVHAGQSVKASNEEGLPPWSEWRDNRAKWKIGALKCFQHGRLKPLRPEPVLSLGEDEATPG